MDALRTLARTSRILNLRRACPRPRIFRSKLAWSWSPEHKKQASRLPSSKAPDSSNGLSSVVSESPVMTRPILTPLLIGLLSQAVLRLGCKEIRVRGLENFVGRLKELKGGTKRGGLVTGERPFIGILISFAKEGTDVKVANHVSVLDDPLMWGAALPTWTFTDSKTTRWTLGASDIIFTNPYVISFATGHASGGTFVVKWLSPDFPISQDLCGILQERSGVGDFQGQWYISRSS